MNTYEKLQRTQAAEKWLRGHQGAVVYMTVSY